VLPYYRQLVESVDVPVIWNSDGNMEQPLPFAIEGGFAGFHELEPAAGMDLRRAKQEYGVDLVLLGNLDIRVLFGADLGRYVPRSIAAWSREHLVGDT
jgi:hypothetical protein